MPVTEGIVVDALQPPYKILQNSHCACCACKYCIFHYKYSLNEPRGLRFTKILAPCL